MTLKELAKQYYTKKIIKNTGVKSYKNHKDHIVMNFLKYNWDNSTTFTTTYKKFKSYLVEFKKQDKLKSKS